MKTKDLALYSIPIRNDIIKYIKNKYIDFPDILHEEDGDGTSVDLVIDEIAWYAIKNFHNLRGTR